MKIVYVVGGLLAPNGMSSVLSAKINYLAEHTDYELYMILTERAGQEWYYHINPKVQWVNFDINFDELDTMPFYKKYFYYKLKLRRYKKLFTDYLLQIRPDITISTVRREINFINDIPDGSKKIGEIHFNRSNYRNISIPFIPSSINKFFSDKWMKKLERQIARLDRFVILTQKDLANWKGIGNISVIPNFITHFPEITSKCTNKQVIAAGRYDPVKGFDMLLQAWKNVFEKHPDWHLDIYGSGNRDEYQQMADNMGLHNVVHCNGPVADIYEKYKESSIFVLSSRNEGFGLVLLEAMASGLPVVSFDCPCGPSDIVRHGKDGFLVENGNIQQLADGLCVLIENPSMRIDFGQKAMVNVRRFSKDNIMKQWISLFQDSRRMRKERLN